MSIENIKVVAFVFARGGSKGLPGKNLRPLAGKPLIGHAIDAGRACSRIDEVVVSTDSEEIAEVARRHGATVPFLRPPELATDTAPEWLAWQHAVRWYSDNCGRLDVFVSLPATSPFRSVEDVEACIDALGQDPETDIVITVTPANRSPYFNMVRMDEAGWARLVIEGTGMTSRRQDAPVVYDMTTVAYAARPEFILRSSRLFDGRVRAVVVPQERALDIDTPFDFQVAECIARARARAGGLEAVP